MSSFQVREPAEPGRERSRSGFTLIEVLVAMVIGGLLTGVIFQLMQGQANFVDVQSARQEVQQNSRGTLELISSELRAVPPGGIVRAEQSRLEMRLPRVWGFTCDATGETKKSVWILVPRGTFPADFPATPSQATNWGLAVPTTTGSWRWITISSAVAGTPVCNAAVNTEDLANFDAYQVTYGITLGTTRPPGTEVFIWQTATYEAGTGASSSRLWVKRNNGASAPQVMAGPLAESGGLEFAYWCGDSRMTPPGSNVNGGFPQITAVQVKVSMESARGTAAGRQAQTDSSRVMLRNTHGGNIPC